MTCLCERQTQQVQEKTKALACLTEEFQQKAEEATLAQQTIEANAASHSHMTAEFAAMQAVVQQVRSTEAATQQELAELRQSQLRLQQEVDRLTQENADLVGHNNLNQKIKIHFRLKEENNKLKELNHKLKEDARKAQEKANTLGKKLEALAKTNGGPAAARPAGDRRRTGQSARPDRNERPGTSRRHTGRPGQAGHLHHRPEISDRRTKEDR